MDAALLDVLEDRAHVALLVVAEGVDVELDGVLEERVEVDGVVGRDLRGLEHVLLEVGVIVDDGHAAPAEHVARTDQQRIADPSGDVLGIRQGLRRRRGRVCDVKTVEQARKAVAVLGQVDGLGLGAHDRHARRLEALGEVDGSLSAERHDDALGLLGLDDVHDVLEGEGLEVQTVRGVVVRRDGLGVAVDHDGLVALGGKGVGGMHAAVVELDALADAVGTGGEDHDARLGGLVELGRAALLVGEVVVARARRELAGTGVDGLEERTHAHDLAKRPHDVLALTGEVANLDVREAELLGRHHVLVVEPRQTETGDRGLGADDVLDAVEEPAVDVRELEDALHAPAATQRLGDVEDALGRGRRHMPLEVLLVEGVMTVSAEPGVPLLERAHGLLHGLLEGGADRHDLAHGLHAGGEGVVGALELLEGEARDLDHAVVDRGLEAGGRRARDVVLDLVERVAHGEERGELGDGESRRLGGERRGAADARVHLDDKDATVVRVDGELDVRAAAGDADALEDGERVVPQALELEVVERLTGCHGDGVARVHAHGVEVLDRADHDSVAHGVAHDLHLDLLPALDALLDEDLALGRERKSLAGDAEKVVVVVGHAAAGAAEREGGTDHHGISEVVGDALALLEGVRHVGLGDLEADVAHGVGKELAVLTRLDGVDVAADDLDAVCVEHARLRERDGAVEAGLAAHVGEKGVGSLDLDDLGDGLDRDRLDVGAIGGLGIGHNRGGVGVHEHDLVTLAAQRLAGLRAGVVELAGLADDDGARSDDEDLLDVVTSGHQKRLPSRTSMAR